jgi:hypothetical protein
MIQIMAKIKTPVSVHYVLWDSLSYSSIKTDCYCQSINAMKQHFGDSLVGYLVHKQILEVIQEVSL